MNKFDELYMELVKLSKELHSYYDVDKIKPYSVYVWNKGDIEDDDENIFDIMADKIVFYGIHGEHDLVEESRLIIKKIQDKLKEMQNEAR